VGTEKVLPLCLIVTEVVTNSLKYSHPAGVPGKLVLGCRNGSDGSLLIEVGDDGIGLPEGFEFADHGGIGSRTIRVLAKQLGAEVSLESRPIGSWFKLRLPSPG
jgi:two-component sensor histidine kinase